MQRTIRLFFLSLFVLFCLVAPLPAQAADYVIKLGHANDPDPDNSIFHAMSLEFQKLVKDYTQGKVEVEIYPAAQLGGEQEMVRGCQLGTQESALVSMNNLNVFATALGFFTLPYMFNNTEEGRYVIDKMWDRINEWSTAQAGVRVLVITDAGFRLLTNSKRCVKNLSDLKGLKIRVPNNPIMIKGFKSFGFDPIPMPWPIFSELQQGVIDGQENPINVMLAVKFYEVQKYVSDIDWIFQTGALVISEQFFTGLPDDLRKAVVKAGRDTMIWERAYVEKITASDIKKLKELGTVFCGPPEDKEEWIKRARGIWPDMYKGIGNGNADEGKAIVDQILEAAKEFGK